MRPATRTRPGCGLSEMDHVWLVGMMGSGKTTVGVLVAQILGLPFVDIDAEIMADTGRTIVELFDDGEDHFRNVETEALKRIAGGERSVIGTGGGAIVLRQNVSVMQASGTIILLDVDVATIVDRVGLDPERPLLNSVDAVADIFEIRREMYNAVADHVVETVGREPSEVAREVAACIDT